MSSMGGETAAKPTSRAGAAKPPIDLTSQPDTGHAMAAMPDTASGGAMASPTGAPTADPKKKKLDWQSMIKGGLMAASNSIDDQADPMAIMQQLQQMAASTRGQVVQ